MVMIPAGTLGFISETQDDGTSGPRAESSRDSSPQPTVDSTTPAGASPKRSVGSSRLRRLLITTDAAALAIGWFGTSLVTWYVAGLNRSTMSWLMVMALGIVLSLGLLYSRGLYLSRVTTIRAVEAAKVTTTLALSTVATYLLLAVVDMNRIVTGYEIYLIFLMSSFFVVTGRGFYQSWLTRRRAQGEYARGVLILGSNREAKNLIDRLESSPGLGYSVEGVLGYPGEASHVGIDVDRLLIGSIENAQHHIETRGIQGAILVESAIAVTDRQAIVQRLLQLGLHVQITGGVRGFDQSRVRTHPLADTALLYLEPAVLGRWQLLFKRALDVVVAGSLLTILSPFVVMGAIAVKLYDRGPVFQKLPRLDQNGRTYSVSTLRTTVTADKLAALGEEDLNRPRPLWSDPYRTPVGRVLEATCINEVPQLWSILRGVTSLVGHRPTWADDPEAGRTGQSPLRPGLTGLWRVETRYNDDDMGFLDEYYVENWSVTLDMVILLATLDKLIQRLFHGESWRRMRYTRQVENVAVLPEPATATELTSIAS